MRQQLSVVGVVRGFWVPVMLKHLLDSHTIVVILKRQCLTVVAHTLQLAACLPLIPPGTVVQRIADCVISNGSVVVRSQLVLPVRIAMSLRNRLNRSSQRAGGVDILHLADDVAATIVVIDPRRILMRIIHSDQLSQRIVDVGGGQISALFRCNIAQIIIRILERDSILGNLLYKRRGTIRTVRAVDILIAAGQLACWSACLLRRRIRLNLRSDEKSGYVHCT